MTGTKTFGAIGAVALGGCLVVACSSNNNGNTPSDAGTDTSTSHEGGGGGEAGCAGMGTITGTASYTGSGLLYAGKGTLNVGAISVANITAGPVSDQNYTGITWPGTYTYTLECVPPGTYGVVGYINSTDAGETMPGQNDPQNDNCGVCGVPIVTVVAGQSVTADLMLTDPATATCGGDDGGEEGGPMEGGPGGGDAGDAGTKEDAGDLKDAAKD